MNGLLAHLFGVEGLGVQAGFVWLYSLGATGRTALRSTDAVLDIFARPWTTSYGHDSRIPVSSHQQLCTQSIAESNSPRPCTLHPRREGTSEPNFKPSIALYVGVGVGVVRRRETIIYIP